MSEVQSLAQPEDADLDRGRVEKLLARARREVDSGRLDGVQVALARRHQLIAFESYGSATQGGEAKPVTGSTMFHLYSVSKGVVGIAFWKLIEEGKVAIDRRVADYIPQFAENGKGEVTVRQVLAHLGGFPQANLELDEYRDGLAGRLRAFARWTLEYAPGEVYEAHANAGHWVLVTIMQLITGEDFRRTVTRFAHQASGTEDYWLGLPSELHARVADVGWKGEQIEPPGGWKGMTPTLLAGINHPESRKSGLPGGGAIGTARSVALFYQTFANGGVNAKGEPMLKPETIALGTTVVTGAQHHDGVTGAAPNRALSVVLAGDDPEQRAKRGFGRSVSPRAFGHGGVGGQIGWADPDTGLSFAFCTNSIVSPQSEWFERNAELSTLAGDTLA